ncbi:MAG TPA: ATP synthase subunit I [Roseovarius sp.]
MIGAIDWIAFALGMLAGTVAGALYFAGLAWGVRLALRRGRTVAVLLPSAAIRIALLLAAGWATAQLGAAALAGFALVFLAMRFFLVAMVRPKDVSGGAECN